jgi:hypothetical protein
MTEVELTRLEIPRTYVGNTKQLQSEQFNKLLFVHIKLRWPGSCIGFSHFTMDCVVTGEKLTASHEINVKAF